ncbi:MAG TPA: transglycosylase SLT domain-containing protein [Gemmatimonadales bacterium]
MLLTLLAGSAGGQRLDGSLLRAESLLIAGRPWHAAEELLLVHARETRPHAQLVVEGAKAEIRARRYDRARALLEEQPWLEDYERGEALAVLAEAEAELGLLDRAAEHYSAARARAREVRAALLAVREGVVREALGDLEGAARAYGEARRLAPLASIDHWLRLRLARVTPDTSLAFQLLADLPAPIARSAPAARGRARLAAGDSTGALAEFTAGGRLLDAARLALALGDSAGARTATYRLLATSPETDDAAAAVGIALGALPPRTASERAELAGAMRERGSAADARTHAERAVRAGDSTSRTLLLLADLEAATGRLRQAAATYRVAADRDSLVAALALYRRARTLVRLGDGGAASALAGFADRFPTDTAAPTALFVLADMLVDRGDAAGAARWFGELLRRYPGDQRASLARFRLAADVYRDGRRDSAAALYQAEVQANGSQRDAARFWLGKIAAQGGDSAAAHRLWGAVARDDSLGYYGLRARRAAGLPVPTVANTAPAPVPPVVRSALARLDTLVLAGLDSEARVEVRAVIQRPPDGLPELLAWSEGLMTRGWGYPAIRLAWQAFVIAPADPRVIRAIYPWPNPGAVAAEAAEFGVDPYLLAGLVRQESTFDPEALSPAGARGLAQLMLNTARQTARGLDVAFAPGWITVPDLNLHLGAAHLAELLRRFGGRVEAALAAYNAGGRPAARWLERPEAADPDQFIELITYPQTRGYVRSVIRNRDLYRALYPPRQSEPESR